MINKRVFIPIAAVSFIQGATSLLSVYLSESGISYTAIATLVSLIGIGGLVGGIFGGILSDHYNPKYLSLIISPVWILAPVLLSQENVILKGLALFFIGVGLSGIRSIFLAFIVTRSLEQNLEKHLSMRRLVINLCVSLGSAIVGVLLSKDEDNFIIYIIGFGVLFTLSIISIQFREATHSRKKDNIETINLNSNTPFAFSLIAVFIALICFSYIPVFYTLYLKDIKQFSIEITGYVFSFSGFLIVTLQMFVTKLIEKINLHFRVIIGTLLISTGIYIVQYIDNYVGLFASVFIWTLGEIILFVPALKLIMQYTTVSNGKTISMYQSLFSLSDFAGPAIGGVFISLGYAYLWDFTLLMGITASFILLILYKTKGFAGEYNHS